MDERWMTNLALRDSLYQTDIPYVPILVEDIRKYISLIDYEEKCVKSIQTIGKIVYEPRRSEIISVTPGTNERFPLSLEFLKKHDAATIMPSGKIHNKVFKILGLLKEKEGKIVLEPYNIIVVENVEMSWRTLVMLAKLSRYEYSQYSRTPELEEQMERYWDKSEKDCSRKLCE